MHPPTDDEINGYQQILPPDDFDWDTSKNYFKTYSMGEEYTAISNFITASILLISEYQSQLQLSSVEMTWGFMSFIE